MFLGYPGQVWAACYISINWLQAIIANQPSNPGAWVAPVQTVYATIRNGIHSIGAWQAGIMLSNEYNILDNIFSFPISISSVDQANAINRLNGLNTFASGVSLLPQPVAISDVINNITNSIPAVSDPGFLEYCLTYTNELTIAGVTSGNITPYSYGMSSSWSNIASAISGYQGNNTTNVYDSAVRMANQSLFQYVQLNNVISTISYSNVPWLWNQLVAVPTYLGLKSSLISSPSTLLNQQCGVIKYALGNVLQELSLLLLTLRQPKLSNNVNIATLSANDTLMDFAARNTGNFENWKNIALINNISPPYPGPYNTTSPINKNLLTNNSSVVTSFNYVNNVLGVDVDFGPINGNMPVWTGDYNLISGYNNYARSAGRRLQTPMGSHIYHVNYGSRIPAEVGAIQSTDEASRLAAFGMAALQSDPRTAVVSNVKASITNGTTANFSATIKPIGFSSTPIGINEVISPLS